MNLLGDFYRKAPSISEMLHHQNYADPLGPPTQVLGVPWVEDDIVRVPVVPIPFVAGMSRIPAHTCGTGLAYWESTNYCRGCGIFEEHLDVTDGGQ